MSRRGKETARLDVLVMERQGGRAVRCTGYGVLLMWKMSLRALRSVRSLDTEEAHTQILGIFWPFMELVSLNKSQLRFIRGPGICNWFLFSLWTSGTASRAMKLNVQQIKDLCCVPGTVGAQQAAGDKAGPLSAELPSLV